MLEHLWIYVLLFLIKVIFNGLSAAFVSGLLLFGQIPVAFLYLNFWLLCTKIIKSGHINKQNGSPKYYITMGTLLLCLGIYLAGPTL